MCRRCRRRARRDAAGGAAKVLSTASRAPPGGAIAAAGMSPGQRRVRGRLDVDQLVPGPIAASWAAVSDAVQTPVTPNWSSSRALLRVAPVQGVAADDAIPLLQQGQGNGADGRHPRRGGDGATAPSSSATHFSSAADRRVPRGGCTWAGQSPREAGRAFVGCRKRERRGLVDRHRQGAVVLQRVPGRRESPCCDVP